MVGGHAAGGGGGGAQLVPIFAHYETDTGVYGEGGLNWKLIWDGTGDTVDPEGWLETSTYKIFTFPTGGVLEIDVTYAFSRSSGGDLYHRAIFYDESEVYLGEGWLTDWATTVYTHSSSGAHVTVPISDGFQFQVQIIGGGGWGTSLTNQATRMTVTLWVPA
jgi:hypothetical protein